MTLLAYLFAVLPFCLLGFFSCCPDCCAEHIGSGCSDCIGGVMPAGLAVEIDGFTDDAAALNGSYTVVPISSCWWEVTFAEVCGVDRLIVILGAGGNQIHTQLALVGDVTYEWSCPYVPPIDCMRMAYNMLAEGQALGCSGGDSPTTCTVAACGELPPDEPCEGAPAGAGGDSDWLCVDGEWDLRDDNCEEGFEPCRPPAGDCNVENEVVTTDCVEVGTCPEPDPAGGTADWLCVDGEWMLTGETCTGDGSPCPPVLPCDENDTATTDCELPEDCNEPPAGGGPCEWIWDSGNWTGPTGGCDAGYDCDPPPIVGGEVDNDLAYTPCYDEDDAVPGGCQGYACAWIGNVGGGWDRIDNSAVVCVAPCQCQPPAAGAMFGQLEFTDCFGSA